MIGPHFPRSLSIPIVSSPPKTSFSLTPNFILKDFFGLDQAFLHLVKVLILPFHAFDLTFWDFVLKILGFFKIDEVIVKFLGWNLYFF